MRKKWLKRAALLLASLLATLLLAEVGTRIVFAFKMGPGILLYCIKGDRKHVLAPPIRAWDEWITADETVKDDQHSDVGSYWKYFPHQKKRGAVYGENGGVEQCDIRINNFGFRGEDISKEKDDGVIRVIALGASSTFGYADRDDETYPFYLEQYLNGMLSGNPSGSVRSFEVLNFGIPHLNSSNLLALFMTEALSFDPDVVTFYEGVNDTRLIRRYLHQRALLLLARFSLLMRYVEFSLTSYLQTFSKTDIMRHSEGRGAFFVENVARIADECRKRGILFIAVSQQAKSTRFSQETINDYPYAREVEYIQGLVDAGKRIRFDGALLLIHSEIMDSLREWTQAENIPFIDMIESMNRARKRHCLLSWVHLSPEGNRFIASELGSEIFSRVCNGGR
jgi:lysophospholipase L1-like esterase